MKGNLAAPFTIGELLGDEFNLSIRNAEPNKIRADFFRARTLVGDDLGNLVSSFGEP